MAEFQQFLAGMLLQDYVGAPYSVTSWAITGARTVRRYSAAVKYTSSNHLTQARDSDGLEAEGGNNDCREGYQDGTVFPLEKKTLNVTRAEDRLCFVVSELQEVLLGAGYVTELIRRIDWKKLTETLLNDRELVKDLFSQDSIITDFFDDKMSRKFLEGIKKIEHKYFVYLSSPSTYTINKNAMELSARYSPNSSSWASWPLPEAENPTDVSRKDRVQSIFNVLARGIKGVETASPERNPKAILTSTDTSRRDEKALLVDLEGV